MNIIVQRDAQDNLNYHFYYKPRDNEYYAFTIFRDVLADILGDSWELDKLDTRIKLDGYAEVKLTRV